MTYSGLNENGLHRHIYLNVHSAVGELFGFRRWHTGGGLMLLWVVFVFSENHPMHPYLSVSLYLPLFSVMARNPMSGLSYVSSAIPTAMLPCFLPWVHELYYPPEPRTQI